MLDERAGRKPPRGLARLAFRLPIWLYRLHLGWILGERFLLLQHIGRKTGRLRETVLEIVRSDPVEGTYIIAAGFGEESDWFQNLVQTPRATIQVGRLKIGVQAERISHEEAISEYQTYAQQHPAALRGLGSLLGIRLSGTDADYPVLASRLPMIRLVKELKASENPIHKPAGV